MSISNVISKKVDKRWIERGGKCQNREGRIN